MRGLLPDWTKSMPDLRSSTKTCDSSFATRRYPLIRGYPAELCKPGVTLTELFRYNAARGDYGMAMSKGMSQNAWLKSSATKMSRRIRR